ncbi:RING finger protein 17 [Biomphalaria glabrata]|nr:RING finger protein 17 [Biomphalaria glabrata]
MEEHKPVPFQISTNISKNKKDLALETICKDHNRPIEYFCQDDSFSICSRCYILGDHKNHSIISYEEKNKSVINDIDSELKRAVDVLDFLNKIDKQITQTLPVVKDETKSVIESINTSFLTLHALLQVREMELINSLTYSLKENLLHIEEQKLLLSKEKTLLEAAIKDANKLIENNALLIDAETLLEILKGAKKIPCIVDKKIEADIEPINWVESNCNNLLQSINAFGEIKGKQQLLIDFKTLEEAGNISSENAKISIKSNETDANKHTVMDIAVSVSTLEYNETSVSARANNESDKTSDLNTKDFTEKITISECSSHFIIKDNSNLTVKGLPQHVIVTHIRSPNNFYVQLQSSKAQLFTLSQSINSWCQREMGAKKIPFAVAKNMFVLARYSADKMWYRARIIDVYESKHGEGQLKILVTYIDFGNEEEVCLKDLRKMEKRFAKVPVFAIHCSLFDIAPYLENKPWSLEAIQDFHQMTQNHIFLLSVLSKQGELHEVDLVFMPTENVLDDGFVSVRDILVFLELGRFKMFSNEALNIPQAASYQKVDFIQPKALTVGSTFDVIVTCAISPWDFFVALTDSGQDYYNTTFQQMQEVYNKDFTNTYGLYYPRAGNVCSVKNENNKWYRGRILSSSKNKQATVNYVDTGAVQVVTFDHLKKLHCDFLKLPVQAVHCKLSAICPLDGSSTITEENWFQKVVLGSEAFIKVMEWSNFAEVFLWLGKETDTVVCESINNKLVEMNLAKNVELPSIKQSTLFDIDDVKKEKELQLCSLDEGKNILENTSPPCTPEDQENLIVVQVNTSSEIHHNELPINPEPDLNNFKKFRKQKANVYSKSNLKDDLNKELPQENQSSVKIISDSSKSFTLSSCIKVLMSFYKSPSDFYVRIIDKEDNLKELMEGLQAFYAGSIHETSIRWKVNDYCTAKFSDNKWYRCNIIEKLSDHEYVLHSVDYGYEHKLESCDMRRLTNEFGTKLECTAVRCHLAELLPAGSMDKNNWSKTAGEYMYQAIKDKILYIKQEGDPTELGLPVDIIMEEEKPETAFDPATHSYHSLRQCILKQGLAMPAKKSLSNKSHSDLILNRIIYEVDGQHNEHLVPSELSEANVKARSEKVTKSEPFLPCSFENSLSTDEGENTKTGVINNLDFCSKNDNVFQVPFPPLPSVGSTLSVVVTHITDDGVIWSQPISWSSDVTQLCQELLNIFGAFNSKSIKQNMIVWRIGDICVSPFENDKLWYRAEIKDICKCRAEVFYLDFGNSAWVNLIDLAKIPSHLVDKHRMCYSLKLDDISLFPTPVLNPSTIKEINKLIISVESNIVVRDIEESTHLITVSINSLIFYLKQ